MSIITIIAGGLLIFIFCALAAIGLAYLTNGKEAAEKVYQNLLAPIGQAFSPKEE